MPKLSFLKPGKINKKMSFEKRKSMTGYGFISLWIIGFIFFFVRPLISVAVYSVSKIEYMDVGYKIVFKGAQQYVRAFLEDPDILRMMSNSFLNMIINVPVIIIVSFVISVLLNAKFKGRTLARTIFFVPVIVAGGIVLSILNGDVMASTMLAGQKSSALLQVSGLKSIMFGLGLPEQIINIVTTASNSIFDLLWKSGIQILLFLASLQTISPSLFEASSIEGATKWDDFWKITMPMVSPIILLTIVYSIIDSFTDYGNEFMRKITDFARGASIEYSSALSLIYFVAILVLVGIVYKIVNRFVFYSVD